MTNCCALRNYESTTLVFIHKIGRLSIASRWSDSSAAPATHRRQGNTDEALLHADVALRRGDYRELPEFIEEACIAAGREPLVDAALLDLGLNNAQIEDPSRGISFCEDGPLDMRMDRSKGETAASLLNRAGPFEIEKILRDYGDENWARKIAQIIVDRRKDAPLQTTDDLVDCVMAAIPPSKREKRIHPATRTFQAIRIAVNHELDDLESCLTAIARRLAPGGVFAVLSYHSGEDRATKRAFRELSGEGYEEVSRKPMVPSADEIARNPKSRSAKLRALKRPAQTDQEISA